MKSIIGSSTFVSPLTQQSILRPKGKSFKKTVVMALTLTSLVDAFSVIVIYLLVSTGTGSAAADRMKEVKDLPKAVSSDYLKNGVIVRVQEGKVYIDDQHVPNSQVLLAFDKLAQSQPEAERSLIIQAGKRLDYDILSPVLYAASRAGFSKVQFAVLKGDTGI